MQRNQPGAGDAGPGWRGYPQTAQNLCHVLCILAEDSDFLQLRQRLAGCSRLTVSWCPSPREAIQGGRRADVVLWQEHLVIEDQELTLRLLTAHLQAPVVVLGQEGGEDALRRYLLMGAADYMDRQEAGPALLQAGVLRVWYQSLAQATLRARGNTDSLTGLPDRTVFLDRLQQALYRAERGGSRVTLCLLNIDRFRRVNQRHGFRLGDQVLRQVALRLKQVLRRSDSLTRLRADEFGLVAETGEDAIDVDQIRGKLAHVVAEPFHLSGGTLELTASVGLAVYPDGGITAEQLLRHAALALAAARKDEGGSIRIHRHSGAAGSEASVQLEADFRRALRSDQLTIHYQPRIDIQTGTVIGVEALVRWPHPRRGLLMPEEFLPLAENSGMSVPMGYWVLQRACADFVRLREFGHHDLLHSVNLSFRQFRDPKLVETLFRILYNANVDTTCFELELTESTLAFDHDHACRCMTELTRLGLRFALDDFGTGYASFGNLRHLPVSSVKIDRSFVAQADRRPEDAALLGGMISLSHQLGLTVVAEGVENGEQLEFLRNHDCDQAQGHLIASALPFDDLCTWLAGAGGEGLVDRASAAWTAREGKK